MTAAVKAAYTFKFYGKYDPEVFALYSSGSLELETVIKRSVESLKVLLDEANIITDTNMIGDSLIFDGESYKVLYFREGEVYQEFHDTL